MDPWAIEVTRTTTSTSSTNPNLDDLLLSDSVNLGTGNETKGVALGIIVDNQTTSKFEDNFIPNQNFIRTHNHNSEESKSPSAQHHDEKSFQKLPDSEQYLASLESKLRKIQSQATKNSESKELVKSLEQTRESYMIQLLADSDNPTGHIDIPNQEDLQINPILKKLAPEKQALTSEELIHLVNADQLQHSTLSDPETTPEETESKEEREP